MIVISSAELRNHLKKYLDIAKKEQVIIQRGKTDTYVLSMQERHPDGFARGIIRDEIMAGSGKA